MTRALGLDFGTTNSSVALSGSAGQVRLAQYSHATGTVDAYRSLLYFEQQTESRRTTTRRVPGQFLHINPAARILPSHVDDPFFIDVIN